MKILVFTAIAILIPEVFFVIYVYIAVGYASIETRRFIQRRRAQWDIG